jgi:hypothetical protein
MRSWSDRPFSEGVALDQLAGQAAKLRNDGGQSRLVYEIAGNPGWLAKLYKIPLSADEAENLQAIIELPRQMNSTDLAYINRCTAWPVARILQGGCTVGVIMAKAPDRFQTTFNLRQARRDHSRNLAIDWLIGPEERLRRHGIKIPTRQIRLRATWEFLALGDLLHRYGTVYGDWSYSNALWAQGDGEIFFLDMDSVRLRHRHWIESPEWEDPLFPSGQRPYIDCYNDRYKLAVMAVRCITAERRDPKQAFEHLPTDIRTGKFGTALAGALGAASAELRPPAAELLAALSEIRNSAYKIEEEQ